LGVAALQSVEMDALKAALGPNLDVVAARCPERVRDG
jgi:hypothetical protein